MRRKFSAVVLVLPFLLVIGACNNDNTNPPAGPDFLNAEFLNPQNGDTVSGPVTVQIRWTGLTFDCAGIGGANVPGHGHWHFYLDGDYKDLSCTDRLTFDFTGVSAGKHHLTAEFVRNDHTPIDQDTSAHISVTVQ